MAIAVHPELTYVSVAVNGEQYIIAEELIDEVSEKLEWNSPKSRKHGKDQNLKTSWRSIRSMIGTPW